MQKEEFLHFKDQSSWRKWLTQNYKNAREAWLVFYKKHSGITCISYEEALEEALCFGWIDGKMQSIDEEKYVIRYSPRRVKSVWSKLNKDRALRLIESGRMTDAGMARIEEAKKNGYWDKAYTNRKTDELPPDLKNALIKNVDAWYNFQRFANSYRNNYIGWVNEAKSDETRKRRIEKVVKRALHQLFS